MKWIPVKKYKQNAKYMLAVINHIKYNWWLPQHQQDQMLYNAERKGERRKKYIQRSYKFKDTGKIKKYHSY